MIRLLLLSLSLVAGLWAHAQIRTTPTEMGTLPEQIDESSGLATAGQKSMWTHNDRGGKAELHEIDLRGELVRTVQLLGIAPVDMEDMAEDDAGNVYIADTGNNKKDRQKLMVYKIDPTRIYEDSIRPQVIEFVLADMGLQSECHYDFESMVWVKDKLYLFSRDRCDRKDNQLHVYSMPDQPGRYTAQFEGEFNWEDKERVVRITGATTSPDGKSLALLSNDAVHFFFGYKKDQFFNGVYRYLPMEKSDKEALVQMTSCALYISEEAKGGEPARLWKLNLCNIDFD